MDAIWKDVAAPPDAGDEATGGSDSDADDSLGRDLQEAAEPGSEAWTLEAEGRLTAAQQDVFDLEKLSAGLDKTFRHTTGDGSHLNDVINHVAKRRQATVEEKKRWWKLAAMKKMRNRVLRKRQTMPRRWLRRRRRLWDQLRKKQRGRPRRPTTPKQPSTMYQAKPSEEQTAGRPNLTRSSLQQCEVLLRNMRGISWHDAVAPSRVGPAICRKALADLVARLAMQAGGLPSTHQPADSPRPSQRQRRGRRRSRSKKRPAKGYGEEHPAVAIEAATLQAGGTPAVLRSPI